MTDLKDNIQAEMNEFGHLIRLLDDEDESIYSNIRSRFISLGESSTHFLKKYLNDENALIKKRANEIVSVLNFENTEEKFRNLSLNNKNDKLEDYMFLLTSFEYPGININIYKRKLDKMSLDIEARLSKPDGDMIQINPAEVLKTINHYLFTEKEFQGNTENYYEPDNSYINRVLDTGLGIPITLSVIYLLISRRLKIPVYGINLPGHFILKYSDNLEEFFIDPFNKGIIITKKEALEFIKKIGMSKDDFDKIPYLKTTTDNEIILRVMRNLIDIYKKTGESRKADQLEKLTFCIFQN